VLAVADAVAHQIYVWLCWRAELHGQTLTRWFGGAAFSLYAALFTVLFAARPILIFCLGWANRGSLDIYPWLGYGVSLVFLVPAIYLMISVRRYFSFAGPSASIISMPSSALHPWSARASSASRQTQCTCSDFAFCGCRRSCSSQPPP
jgi:hypothetical protein